MKQICKHCRFYVAGHCDYRAPPVVLTIIAMADAEPATQIDWAAETVHPPMVQPDHTCSEWRAST